MKKKLALALFASCLITGSAFASIAPLRVFATEKYADNGSAKSGLYPFSVSFTGYDPATQNYHENYTLNSKLNSTTESSYQFVPAGQPLIIHVSGLTVPITADTYNENKTSALYVEEFTSMANCKAKGMASYSCTRVPLPNQNVVAFGLGMGE